MRNPFQFSKSQKVAELFYFIYTFLILISTSVFAQSGPVGPGKGSFKNNNLIGQLINWDRKATPVLVLRVNGAGMLQTFSDISAAGEFNIALPEIPQKGNYGTMNCGDLNKGPIVVVSDFSLLTTLQGFTSPGRWDRGLSVIGMAVYANKYFSENIGKPGGKRGYWLYSKTARTVEAGECNNSNNFQLEEGWNAFTLISGQSGGPHTYNRGLDDDLGWYWYAFPENIVQKNEEGSLNDSKPVNDSEQPNTVLSNVQEEWLFGEWDGVQIDTRIQLRLKPSGDVWLESIEGNRKKTMEGKWMLSKGEFILNIKEGELHFNIEQISETSFRLFGKDAVSDIVFNRKD